eukprot:355924-Chlamydomonas_euryale.AAC.5
MADAEGGEAAAPTPAPQVTMPLDPKVMQEAEAAKDEANKAFKGASRSRPRGRLGSVKLPDLPPPRCPRPAPEGASHPLVEDRMQVRQVAARASFGVLGQICAGFAF